MSNENQDQITLEDFLKVEIVSGTIVSAELNPKARVPAFKLEIDFGAHGIRHSSAQLTRNYNAEELPGMQIVAVMNFPPRRIAGVKSQVLVLGVMCEDEGTVLLAPNKPVGNGMRMG